MVANLIVKSGIVACSIQPELEAKLLNILLSENQCTALQEGLVCLCKKISVPEDLCMSLQEDLCMSLQEVLCACVERCVCCCRKICVSLQICVFVGRSMYMQETHKSQYNPFSVVGSSISVLAFATIFQSVENKRAIMISPDKQACKLSYLYKKYSY